MSEYNTQPTMQTLLEEMRAGFAAAAEQFKIIHTRLDRIEAKMALALDGAPLASERPLYVYIGPDGCYHVGGLDGPRLLPLDAGKCEP
jgi:hypothetical protein